MKGEREREGKKKGKVAGYQGRAMALMKQLGRR